MDTLDSRILNIIQSDFPLCSHPYEEIGKQVGLTESEVLARVRALKQQNVIRRIGGNFQSKKLGWHSTLCAARVPEDRMDEFIAAVNKRRGATHNYERRHTYNIWFTMIGPSKEAVAEELQAITRETGIDILNLPAQRMYKIKVDFKIEEQKEA